MIRAERGAARACTMAWTLLVATMLLLPAALAQPETDAPPPPPAGSPVEVEPTPNFNPRKDTHFSTGDQNPNPEVLAQWQLVFDPKPPYAVVHIMTALIPGTMDKYLALYKALEVDRPGDKHAAGAILDLSESSLAGTLGTPMAVQENVTIYSNPWCAHLQQTHDGKILVVGGASALGDFPDGTKGIRLYDYEANPLDVPNVTRSWDGRWYPSLTLMPDRTILIQGGTQRQGENTGNSTRMEVWSPEEPTSQPKLIDLPLDYVVDVGKNWFPMQFLLPTGDVWIQNDDQIRIFLQDGTFWNDTIPPYPSDISNQWPRSGASVLGPLTAADNYTSVDIIVFGGAPKNNTCLYGEPDNRILAVRDVHRLRIEWTIDSEGKATYNFPEGKWTKEDMGIPRTGGDATILPCGDIILASGAQRGCHGGQGSNPDDPKTLMPRGSFPAFWPILYQTDMELKNASSSRITVLPGSPIPRMYHHSTALTLDGHVLIAGCDECRNTTFFNEGVDALVRDAGWWSPSKNLKREYRVEIIKTPYSMDVNNQPEIVDIDGETDATATVTTTWDAVIEVTWKSAKPSDELALVPVTGASLVAPAATTHGYNNNHRVMKLKVESTVPGDTTGTIRLRMPPNAKVAPEQYYLLYLLNGKTNSRARWVRLTSAAAAA